MRIAWLTDCHLEWLNQKSRRAFFDAIADERPDVVLLGGDICNFDFLESWLLKFHKKVQVPIYFCLGNHDYYNSSIFEVRELVPPLPEVCLYMGKPSEEGLPFFCCKSAGDALTVVAANNPETRFLVLSGHTHDAADVMVADNLRCIVADAEYGHPTFRIIEILDIFDRY